ncbi:MAG TPA: TIGR03545 family protein [Gemmatimonadaceae bacterium]|nr:TIGR03545 family protein [Gemmatimonadaceae bacterium]
MSTAGSVPPEPAGGGPPASGQPPATPAPPAAPAPRRPGLFRWRGVIPLVLVLVLLVVGWMLFSDMLLRETTIEAATKLLGTEVDLSAFQLHEFAPSVALHDLQVADPFDSTRNLVEVGDLLVDLDPAPLLQKKIVIRRLSLDNVRIGTTRRRPAHPVRGGGFATNLAAELKQWSAKFNVPLLQLTPVDTVRSIVLNPTQLQTVQQALALKGHADSVQTALRQGFQDLHLQQTLDSAQALAKRLHGMRPLQLGIGGTRKAISDVKRTIDEINQARQRVETLQRNAKSGLALLDTGVRALDDARQADYAFARGLLKLPTFDAPDIGSALFGHVTIDRFQQALYWANLAREYMPPGLLPHKTPGPKRLRMAGTTVYFIAQQAYPDFLLEQGDVHFTVPGTGYASGSYALAVQNLTSEPALVGKPTVFAVRRMDDGKGSLSFDARGLIDHTSGRDHESLTINAAHFPLPTFPLPGLPFRADPRRGSTALAFDLHGDRLSGQWTVRSDSVAWTQDSARSSLPAQLVPLIARVIRGLGALDVTAKVNGTITAPHLSVSSNLDRALADGLRNVAGEEVAKAEAQARAKVDSLTRDKVQPVLAQVTALHTEADQRVAQATAQLDAVKQQLDEELKALSGGLIKLPKLPGI